MAIAHIFASEALHYTYKSYESIFITQIYLECGLSDYMCVCVFACDMSGTGRWSKRECFLSYYISKNMVESIRPECCELDYRRGMFVCYLYVSKLIKTVALFVNRLKSSWSCEMKPAFNQCYIRRFVFFVVLQNRFQF